MKSLRFVLAMVTTLGCGGAATEGAGGTTTPGAGPAKPAAAGDVTLDIPAIQLQGLLFEPEALGRPGMPLYAPKNTRLTIDQQKKIFGATKNAVEKQAQAAVLATMLYQESKKATGDAATKLVTEARDVLRTSAAAAGTAIDEITLRLLGSYEIQLEDWAAAEKAWDALVKKAPKDPNTHEHKAWWIYSLLRQYKNTEALAVAGADPASPKQPLLAYATAWAKFRANDDAGAWQAIAAAAEGWGTNANREALDRDVLLFAGRSNVPLDKVTPELFKVFNAKQPAQQYEVLAKLGRLSYQYAGRWEDGVAAIEGAFKIAGGTVPPLDKVVLKFHVADFLVPLDQPDASARNAKEALAGMPACTTCKPKDKTDLVTAIYGIARTFHLLYATANDVRYYQPAHDLYAETIPLMQDNALRTQAKTDLDTLQRTLKNTKAGTGTHEKQAIGVLLNRHNQEIQACYEEALAANPKLAGQLTLQLDSDASGEIKGASTEPKAGADGMSAVAQCATDRAKQWKLPKRGMAGTTRIKLQYSLSAKK